MSGPVSYKDPAYDTLDARVTAKLGLPQGLLSSIRTKGERSDADAVSEKGARTVYQIIPATRQAAIQKWGIDPYASAENAAEVAGLLLKDSLTSNNGDIKAAVGEYHGGTDRSQWGPRTKAYVGRVVGGPEPSANRTPSVPQRVVDAYNDGSMSEADRAALERGLKAGQVTLPPGVALTKPQQQPGQAQSGATVIPQRVINNYVNHSEMSDAERNLIDRDIANGNLALPPGVTLTRPAPRTVGDELGMGVRSIATGAGKLLDFAATPIRGAMNLASEAAIGRPVVPTFTESTVEPLANAAGLPVPATKSEKAVAAVNEGLTQGLMTSGIGAGIQGAGGVTGLVGKALADAPVKNAVSNASAALSGEVARQNGAGPWGQLGASLLGGFGGYTSAAAAERGAAAFGPKVAKAVATHPPEEVFDETGALTENGREVAARAGVKPEELKAAYDDAAKPEAPQRMVRTHEGVDYPVEVIGERVESADGGPYVKVRGEDGTEGFVPEGEVRPAPEAPQKPQDAPEAAAAASAPDNTPLPASAAARHAEAASENIPLSKGEATQDFGHQDAENSLRAAPTPQGQKARDFKEEQQARIGEAVQRFQEGFGDTGASAADRGQMVQQAIAELRDQGKAGVTALYKALESKVEAFAGKASNLVNLDTAPILAKLRELFIDESVPEPTRKALKQLAAKHGLIGENPKTVEGETSVTLKDNEGNPAGKISFTGAQEPLTIANAEKFRQKVNALYDPIGGRGNPQEALKPLIDDAVEGALARAAREGGSDISEAAQAARQAHQTQQQTYNAADIVKKVSAWKRGGAKGEFQMNPETVIRSIFGSGKDAVTNLKRIRAVLLSKPTEQSKAAWRAIQAHGIAQIFDQALSPNGQISGARLNSAMKKFGDDKLKILLEPADYNHLQKLRRIIGNATIPLPNTTNPSGSGYKVINFLAQQASRLSGVAKLVPGVGPVADAGIAMAKNAHAAGQAEKTLKGIREFGPEDAAKHDAPKSNVVRPEKFARAFVDAAKSDAMLKSVLASAQQSGEVP